MGHVLRWTTAGESHGRALVAVVEGMVAGVTVTSEDIAGQLRRRRLGYGRGARMKFEQDQVDPARRSAARAHAGRPDRHRDRQHRMAEMGDRDGSRPGGRRGAGRRCARNAPLTRPRPGHADYAGMLKYGFDDARPVLERASARETAARVAAAPSPGFPAAGARRRGALARHLHRRVRAATTDRRRSPPTLPRSTTARCAPSTRRVKRDDRRDRGRQEGR